MIYLFGAFGIIWLALFVYIFMVDRKCSELEKEIEGFGKNSKAG